MSSETERAKIIKFFQDNWNATTCPPKYPNQPFLEPADKFYCHVLLIKGVDQRLTIGKDRYLVRCYSNLQIDIYGPLDQGEARHNAAIDAITALFADRQMRTSDDELITFRQPNRMTFGPRGGYYRITVRVPFYRDEFRTVAE